MRKFRNQYGNRHGRNRATETTDKRGRPSKTKLDRNVKLLLSDYMEREMNKEAEHLDIPFAELARRWFDKELKRLKAVRGRKIINLDEQRKVA